MAAITTKLSAPTVTLPSTPTAPLPTNRRGQLFPGLPQPTCPPRKSVIRDVRRIDPDFTMTRIAFFVPQEDNDGVPFGNHTWQWLHDQLFRIAGGFSLNGLVQGQWRDDKSGQVYHDQSRAYIVAVPADKVAVLFDLIHEVKARFRQEAIYVERHNHAVAIVR